MKRAKSINLKESVLLSSLHYFHLLMSIYHYLVPCTYVFIRELLTLHVFGKQHKSLAAIVGVCVSTLLMILALITFLVYLIVNSIIKLILILRHSKEYGGILRMDSYFECAKNRITSVYIIEHSGTFEELYENIKISCGALYESHYRFSSIVKSFCGFLYFVKNKVCLDDIISIEDHNEVLTKQWFMDYLEKHCFSAFDNNALWNVKVFNKPIMWNDISKVHYPVLVSYNHCIGDGIALSVYVQKFLLSDVKNDCFEKVIRKSPKSKDILKTSNIGSVFLMGPKLDYPNLNSVDPTQRLAIFIEDEPKYLKIISYLSKRLMCSFTDVITTAALASVRNYLKVEGVNPTNIIVYNTTRPLGDDIESLLQGSILKNCFTLDAFNLPWMKQDKLLAKFSEIKSILKDGKNSATGQIIYLLTIILSHLHPVLLTNFVEFNSMGTTLGITNIPCAEYGKIGNCPVEDTFSFVNHFAHTKFVLVVSSYNHRIQACLISKKHLKTSRVELQMMLENIFLNIDKLYEEVKSL